MVWFLGVFCTYFQDFLWSLGRPHDAHDADDAGSWGAAGRLKRTINPDKTLTIHSVGSVCSSMLFLMPCLEFLTPPGINGPKWGPIVLMMLLYEARALRTGTSSAQLGPHFGSF